MAYQPHHAQQEDHRNRRFSAARRSLRHEASEPGSGRGKRLMAWTVLAAVGAMGGSFLASVSPASATGANSYSLYQCANGKSSNPAVDCNGSAYRHGDLNQSNSQWTEGDFLPFQLRLTGLSKGDHTVVLQYQTVFKGKHSYDYLGSFDATATQNNDPCTGVLSDCSNSVQLPITSPNLSALDTTCGSTAKPTGPPTLPSPTGHFTLWGPASSALSGFTYTVQDDQINNGCAAIVSLTVYSPTDNTDMVLAWSAHIASDVDWGAGTGAANINGAPYHMWVNSLDSSGGAEERSLQVAPIANPTLTTVIEDSSNTAVSSIPLGTIVHDTATLSGADPSAGGTVTYELFSNGTCSTDTEVPPTTYPALTVNNGVVPDSPTFTPSQPGIYSYLATYSGDVSDNPATGQCEGPLTVSEQPAPVIDVVKSELTPGDGVTVRAGQVNPITYGLAVSNSGSADATDVVVTDVIPTGTTYVAGSATPDVDASYDSTTNTITWTIPSVAAVSNGDPGEVDLGFQVKVNASDAAGSTIVNQASFTDVNTPNCTAGTQGTCLTNTVSNPVDQAPPVQTATIAGDTTTTTVAPASTTTTSTSAPQSALAFTGSDTGLLSGVGAGLLAAGGLLLLVARRRRSNA